MPRKHANGSKYTATDWVVEPITSLAAALNPWTTYGLDQPKQRKPRTITPPCKFCGEVHPIKQIDYCGGCGAKVDERTIEPIIADADPDSKTDETASDKLSEANPPTVQPSSSPVQLRTVRPFVGGTDHNAQEESDWLRDAPTPPPDDDTLTPRTLFALPLPGCRSCGAAIAEGHTHCRACDPRTA